MRRPKSRRRSQPRRRGCSRSVLLALMSSSRLACRTRSGSNCVPCILGATSTRRSVRLLPCGSWRYRATQLPGQPRAHGMSRQVQRFSQPRATAQRAFYIDHQAGPPFCWRRFPALPCPHGTPRPNLRELHILHSPYYRLVLRLARPIALRLVRLRPHRLCDARLAAPRALLGCLRGAELGVGEDAHRGRRRLLDLALARRGPAEPAVGAPAGLFHELDELLLCNAADRVGFAAVLGSLEETRLDLVQGGGGCAREPVERRRRLATRAPRRHHLPCRDV